MPDIALVVAKLGGQPVAYGRPSSPASATDVASPALNSSSGAGTGIFTQCLVKSPQASAKIAKILAVEPSSGMREGFRKQEDLQSRPGAAPEVEVVDGSFADIPVGSASVDLVVGECPCAALLEVIPIDAGTCLITEPAPASF